MSNTLLNIRRTSIFIILTLAYGYFQVAGDSAALASIGLLSFAAIAQFAPAFFLGLFWRRPTQLSALCGMGAGFGVWFYTLFLPTVLDPSWPIMAAGPFGVGWLHPESLFGVSADALNHGVVFSLLINTLVFCAMSFVRQPKPIERMQAGIFSIISRKTDNIPAREGRSVSVAELTHAVANYLGYERSERAFDLYYKAHDDRPDSREPASDDVIQHAEQLLASAIGAASSRLVMSLLLQKHDPVGETTIQLLDDASEAIQHNRDLLQTALDQVEQGISVFDNEFRLSSWNRQFRELLELPVEMGQAGIPLSTVADAISERANQMPENEHGLIKQLLTSDTPFNLTVKSSGRIIEVLTKLVPDGGLVISWNDTTERALAASALREANESLEKRVQVRTEELTRLNDDLAKARESADAANIGKTKFLAAVGHDILQPLNAARLYTSSLVEQLADSSSKELAGNVDDALESVEDILGAVLAISRLDSGVLVPNITTIPVERLFRKLDVEFRPIAQAKDLKLDVRWNELHVKSDYSLLRRLLQNLISNAIKYTQSGTVSIDAKVRHNTVVFSISDTGPGIDNADMETVFLEFRRLDAGRKAAPGLGLGLSIVQRLATTLDHELNIESKPGSGTVFSVSVPLAVPESVEKKSGQELIPPKLDLSNLCVVCIDNEPRILDGMQTLLGGWGCDVHVFESSRDLLSALPELTPDVLVADYHLNNENGLDVIDAVRAKLPQDFPAVLITADRSAAVQDAANAADIVLLRKPLKPAALRAVLTGVLSQTRAEVLTPAE